jgi:DNA polymerase III delta prime subunit
MNSVLVLHSQTKSHVAQFTEQPVHAVMLVGSNGIGKTFIAEGMLAKLLGIEAAKLATYVYYNRIQPVKGTISIDAIRELQHFLQLKTIGTRPIRRAVIIEHADGLTTEAQNALLKLLEEPPADTILLMTVDNQRALLPTILSRVQSIPVYAPEEKELKAHFAAQNRDEATITQAYFLSGGLPGLMTALLTDDKTHPLLSGVAAAKEVLQKQLFERLALVEGFSKQKEETVYMLQALQHIARTGLSQGATKSDTAKIKQWHHILKVTTEALDALDQSANTKLVLSNLMLKM